MNIEQQIIKLIGELKKETDSEKKKKIKQKLKQLYRQLNRVKTGKKLEFKLPIKKTVEDLLSGQFEDINKIRNTLSAMKKGVDLSINQLKIVLSKERDESKRNEIILKLKKEEAKRQTLIFLAKNIKDINPDDLNEDLRRIDNIQDDDTLQEAIFGLMENYKLNKNQLDKIFVKSGLFENSEYTLNDVIEEFQNVEFREPLLDIQQEAEEEEKEEGEFKQGEDPSFEEKRRRHKSNVADLQASLKRLSKAEKQDEPPFDIDEALNYVKEAREKLESGPQLELASSRPLIPSEVPEIAAQIKGRKKGISSFGSMLNPLKWWGLGKHNKKMKGGAGISDYLSVLGNMPGLSQMAGMVPIIGPMLGPAIGLAQTGSNIASQGMKEAGLGPGEQVKGLFGTIGKLFGMGKPNKMGLELLKAHSGGSLNSFYKKHQKKLNKHGITGAGFLSDIMGTIGGITPHLSSLLGFIPGAGPILQMGNSAIGSATRVGEDIFKKIGLGKKKKGGRKMLPNPLSVDGLYPDNEMNDGMAYIQPYYGTGNLPNGGNVSEEFEDQLNQQIVQLLKNRYLDEIKNTDAFNAQLAAKTNTEQQSAVFQLLYAKLLKDAALEEERRRQE